MIPFYIICAIILLFFLILINKTLEGMEIKEYSYIAQTFMDPDATTDELKIDQLTEKIKNNEITNQDLISIIESSDFTNNQKINKIYDTTIDILHKLRNTSPSVYSDMSPNERLDSTKFKQILSILYNPNIEDSSTKMTLIKELNIKDTYHII